MTVKTTLSQKLVSAFLCLALFVSWVPFTGLSAFAAAGEDFSRTADVSTMDDWTNFFPIEGNLHTENAGGVWTDKSVFTDGSAFGDITFTDKGDNFLVALSAIGSNMTVTGQSNVPTDTVLVLDVSGSMNDNDGNNNVANELTAAANATVATLQATNPHSRVGIVMYSGSTAQGNSTGTGDVVTVLPLGRYETAVDGNFLTYTSVSEQVWDPWEQEWVTETTETISLDDDVVKEGTTTKPAAVSKEVVGGTYMQAGINQARNMFTAKDNQTTVTDPVFGTLTRKPVMVLLSDGAPTTGTTAFTGIGTSNLGDGMDSSASIGFVTQLSMAYAKQQIEIKYGTSSLLYTLGIGLNKISDATDKAIAQYVLNPSSTTNTTSARAIRSFWKDYNSETLAAGDTLEITNNRSVVKVDGLQEYAVTRNFDTAAYGTNLQTALGEAFKAITDDIQLQTKYFPTLVEGSEHLSGYVTFEDNIGEYMEVTDVKGIRLHRTLFSGADLASNFVPAGGLLGTYDQPTRLGEEMVKAVMTRIGLADEDAARTLITLAYRYGQLSYTSNTEFSNYIGWYANAAGEFLGFWHEGMTTMPDPANPELTDATRPAYIMKSYGYLGEVDEAHGVSKSDMMYVTVQVRENIQTGNQTVLFQVPAALLPTVTYEVTLDKAGTLKNLEVSGATAPVRLVYEVALRDDINPFTLNEVVDSAYRVNNLSPDGGVYFYTNSFDKDGSVGYETVNARSSFRPSRQNDRYYYQENALVYTDTNGTLYRHATDGPAGEMYHAYTVYSKNGTSFSADTVYHRLTAETLGTAEKVEGDTAWYIPAGDVRRDYAGYVSPKADATLTETLSFSAAPFTDIYGHSVNDLDHMFVVGATHGNNGRLSVASETGIKLSKTLATDTPSTAESFTFTLENTTVPADSTVYSASLVAADGTAQKTDVTFTSGTATVTLKAGEILYIGGMTAGHTVKITETETEAHVVQSVNGQPGNGVQITITDKTFADAAFVNTVRGTGNLTVSKEVEHPLGDGYVYPADLSFDMMVTFTLNGQPLANRTFTTSHGDRTLNGMGKVLVTLKPEEHLEFFGLPAGTVATVTEAAPGNGWETPVYYDNGQAGDGVVTVTADGTVSVLVLNTYQPDPVSPNITVSGNKTLEGNPLTDTFTFRLQRWNPAIPGWEDKGTAQTVTYTGENGNKTFSFGNVLADEVYDAVGTYSYRVMEETGDKANIVYDTNLHSFSVHVTDADMDGALEIDRVTTTRDQVVHITGDVTAWQVEADFVNVHDNNNVTGITVDVNKQVDDRSGSQTAAKLSGFVFDLKDEQGTVLQTLTTNERGALRFALNYHADDLGNETSKTFTYTVSEHIPEGYVNGSGPWTYDETVATVSVTVTLNGDSTLSAVITESGSNSLTASFTNIYEPAPAELPVTFVGKRLEGRDMVDGEFSFLITGVGNSTSISGTNVGNRVVFESPLTFDKVGTYFFDITEISPDGKGVTTDKTTFRVTVTVTDIEGTLEAAAHLNNVEEAVFVNRYTPKSVPLAIEGTKKLSGRVLINDEFSFLLTVADDALGTVSDGAATYTAANAADGSFVFPTITYHAAGTYYYTVSEQQETGETYGITYDPAVTVVTVVIEENTTIGELVVKSVSHSKEELVFHNTYVAKPTKAIIPGYKVLEGRVLNDQEFAFELHHATETWADDGYIQTVNNGQDGTFAFDSIDFTEAGTYRYLVKEVQGTLGGVTYDTTVFRVQVDVVDDLKGQLHAEVSVFDQNGYPRAEVLFRNLYAVTGTETVELPGTKTIPGQTPTDGAFTFELYETADATAEPTDGPLQTAVNEDGAFVFTLTYEPEDIGKTFYYVAWEKNGGETIDRITYSTDRYRIVVTVSDNGVGGIETETVMMLEDRFVESLDFVNIYTPAPTDVTVNLDVEKTVDNKGTATLAPEGFEFLLEKEGTEGGTTVKSDASGKASFALTFGEGDIGQTYTYFLSEKAGDMANVTYDTTVYTYQITVTLDEETNTLKVAVMQNGDGTETPVAKFTNTYTYTPPTPPTPPILPPTGVDSQLVLWIALFAAAGGAVLVSRKRKSC